MTRKYICTILIMVMITSLPQTTFASEILITKSISVFGEPKYKEGFTHFDYVNPLAPKRGKIKHPVYGTFDSLNPFIIKGIASPQIMLIYDTLLTQSADDHYSAYGLVASKIHQPSNKSWIAFEINPKAKFHDGKKITASDIKFTFEILRSKGSPFYRIYYSDVKQVTTINDSFIRFDFKQNSNNKELPLIIGQMPILPKHYWKNKDFTKTTLEIPLGSGPYRLSKIQAGKQLTFQRVKNYWAKDLNVNIGTYNFDTLQFDYYKDTTISLQALSSGDLDLREEYISKLWATSYDFPAIKNGDIIKAEIPHQRIPQMQAFFFNIRKDKFQDRNVRKAISLTFNFEWANKHLFYNQYKRTTSFFDNSELSAQGLPNTEEIKLLAPYKDILPKDIFSPLPNIPYNKNFMDVRTHLRQAVKLLKQSGYDFIDGKMTNLQTKQTLEFEIITNAANGNTFDRVLMPFINNLAKIGIKANLKKLDVNIYKNRYDKFDFDMIIGSFPQSHLPGNEQKEYWGSEAATRFGSRNIIGIQHPAIDSIIEKIISSNTKDNLVIATKCLDRILLKEYYAIPHWHLPYSRIAYKNIFGIPKITPPNGYQLMTWWIKEDKK